MLKLAISLAFVLNISGIMLALEWIPEQVLDLVINHKESEYIVSMNHIMHDYQLIIHYINADNFWNAESAFIKGISDKIIVITKKIENENTPKEVNISSCKETAKLQIPNEKFNSTLMKIKECVLSMQQPVVEYMSRKNKIYLDGHNRIDRLNIKSDDCINVNYDKSFDKAYICTNKVNDEVALIGHEIFAKLQQEVDEKSKIIDKFDLSDCHFRNELVDIDNQLMSIMENFETCVQQKNEDYFNG